MADFFISFTAADRGWAEWIGFVLEENNYKVVVQPWDIRPGSNFVLEMQQAAANCDRTLILLSPDFLKSGYAASEWAAAFANDPDGARRKLVPVKVRECQPTGILKAIVHIDLSELDQQQAKKALLAGVKEGRGKPSQHPPFPGQSPGTPKFPGLGVPSPDPAPQNTYRPKVKRRPTDLEKHKFIEAGFATIKSHFVLSITDLGSYPHVHGEIASEENLFTARIFVDGGNKAACRVWIGDEFRAETILYAEGSRLPPKGTSNEMLSLADDGSEMFFTALMDMGIRFTGTHVPRDTKRMTPEQAAEYLWSRFVAHIEV